MKQIKLRPNIDEMLTALSKKRKEDGALVFTKQQIVAELVMKQHDHEIKQSSK